MKGGGDCILRPSLGFATLQSTSKARLRLPFPDPAAGFRVDERDGLFMITPRKDKWDWTKDERTYRSIILDKDGYVKSTGFPKFHNAGEPSGMEDESRLVEDLKHGRPVWVGEKLDGCFPTDAKLNLWGGGTTSIGKVVKNKLNPVLVGINDQGELVPTQVTSWFDNGMKNTWMRIGVSTPNSVGVRASAGEYQNRMFVTPNHHIFRDGEYVAAEKIKVGDELVAHTTTFTELDLFFGGLLADGSICRNGDEYNYQECHGESQRQYVVEQKELFDQELGLVKHKDTRGGYANSTNVWLQTRNAKIFKDLRSQWYPNDIKTIPSDLSFMNDAVVAKWFMDAGCREHSPLQKDRATFHTNGFCKEDVERLAQYLRDTYDVNAVVSNAKGWIIRINYTNNAMQNFWKAIAPYVFPSMQYKLPEEHRDNFYSFPTPRFTSCQVISTVESVDYNVAWHGNNYGRTKARAFDIETETHNYMCNGILVHNSLAIRSVVNGEVMFRTRGSWDGGDFGVAMRGVAARKYPALLDPKVHPDGSLLFEFTSPREQFRVVLRYPEDDMTLLGAMDHSNLRQSDLQELQSLSEKHGLKMVETMEVPHSLGDLSKAVRDWEGREGVVVRCNDGQTFVKVKSQSYLALHRLRSHMNSKSLRALCDEHRVTSIPQYRKILEEKGGDWEIFQDSQPMVEAYIGARKASNARFAELDAIVTQKSLEYRGDRKRFATEWAPTLSSHEKPVAFLLLDGREAAAQDKLADSLVSQALERFDKEEEAKLQENPELIPN